MAQHSASTRDHGGGLDAAIARNGGARGDWLDLSTGINPVPYPIEAIPTNAWTALPDRTAAEALTDAARRFWKVPDRAAILAAPGASALIARIPALMPVSTVQISHPTYNEHAAAFAGHGWSVTPDNADTRVVVHPNNPDGALWGPSDHAGLTVIDESFCDVMPEASLIDRAGPGVIVLKSFGKFWGLGGLRLGFAIGDPEMIAQLAEWLGPWPVSGPALAIGARALNDLEWAMQTRQRLAVDTQRLDQLITSDGAELVGGTTLFRLYKVPSAAAKQAQLADHQVWTRIFPYSDSLIRLGLPGPDDWCKLEAAL